LTNPATQWAKYKYYDPELNMDQKSSGWLEGVNKQIFKDISESNFALEAVKTYKFYAACGNSALLHETKLTDAGAFDGFRFTSIHLSNIAWQQNKDGMVDECVISWTMTAKQMAEKWGAENLSKETQKLLADEPHEQIEVLQFIHRRDGIKDIGADLAVPKERPYANIYMESTANHIIQEGGYYEFPIYVPRGTVNPGEHHGRGQGHLALPDTRSLNNLMKEYMTAVARDNNPPLLINQRDYLGSLDIGPRTLNVVRDVNGIRELTSTARSDRVLDLMERKIAAIRSLFFLDKLQPLANLDKKERMSQFEVAKRLEEMNISLGPAINSLITEWLQPMMVRCIKAKIRTGAIPELPPLLREKGLDVKIDFINPLAQSQQVQELSNTQEWLMGIAQLAQFNPEVVDVVNADGIAINNGVILSVPETAIQDPEVVQQIREQRAQQQQQQAAVEQANMAADTAAKLGGTGGTEQEV
jgi:hypothetical protein